MKKPSPELPAPPSENWVYDDAIAYENAMLAHAGQYGKTAEILSSLSMSAARRCAYRTSLDWLSEGLELWPEIDHPVMGVSARVSLIQTAVHCGVHEKANAVLKELADHPHIIQPASADSFAYSFRGTGLQPGAREMLARCLEVFEPNSPWIEAFRILHQEYDSSCELASAVKLISIGNGCYGWLQANRYMLRFAEPDDCLVPFNMSVFPLAGMIAALSDGLAGFDDASQYSTASVYRSVPMVRHKRYTALFNHECDTFFLEDDAAPLRAFYSQRAASFLKKQCIGPRVYVCIQSDFANLEDVEQALAGLMQDDEYLLLFISYQFGACPDMPAKRLPTTRLVHIPLPETGFNWSVSDRTAAGVRYDLAMRAAMRHAMLEVAEL
ncbi:hypothetical protein FPY71_00405 [Aureimonas fodinaquatilis]|uniref:Uncharacterized protein n=1 Tax=Aureimonas fodinaquatilis TaxID=2565783 RepID=A0A5B0DXT3_9HYPH|nr:hypothetical protein [Aureimonas fodinaquatilis]KAA0971637.1 hypothetical protein FPY71_00405 [Aureimonas fodinaquatilis]